VGDGAAEMDTAEPDAGCRESTTGDLDEAAFLCCRYSSLAR
jgi:hypothetical protein